jgi:hypothetical protein
VKFSQSPPATCKAHGCPQIHVTEKPGSGKQLRRAPTTAITAMVFVALVKCDLVILQFKTPKIEVDR